MRPVEDVIAENKAKKGKARPEKSFTRNFQASGESQIRRRDLENGGYKPYPVRAFVWDLMAYLDSRVIGQQAAKKAITGTLLQYIRHGVRQPVLLIGGTGCGKTHLINTAADWLLKNVARVHFASRNTSYLTPEGWHGEDFSETVSHCFGDYQAPNDFYVLHLDEIDKIMMPSHNSADEDVNAQTCSQIMNALSGEDCRLGGVDWSRVLCICTGAFEWLAKEREKYAMENRTPAGFGRAESEAAQPTERQLLERAGVMKELLGRFASITRLDPLDEKAMLQILNLSAEDGGLLATQRALFEKEGVRVVLAPDAKEWIAARAAVDAHGARSISTILHDCLGPEQLVNAILRGQKTIHITGKEGLKDEQRDHISRC